MILELEFPRFKPIIQFLIITVYFFPYALYSQEEITFKDGDISCASTIPPEGAPDPPVWTDERINTDSGRIEIVKEGAEKAFFKLTYIGIQSHIVKLFQWNDLSYNSYFYENAEWNWDIIPKNQLLGKTKRKIPLTGNPNLINSSGRFKVNIEYIRFSRQANVGSRITPHLRLIKADEVFQNTPCGYVTKCNCKENQLPDGSYWSALPTPANNRICYREELNAVIEIFPEIFLRKSLWIPNEKRWARTPDEAVSYLILHELGHLEHFIAENSQYSKYTGTENLSPIGTDDHDEASAWDYAYTIAIRSSGIKKFE